MLFKFKSKITGDLIMLESNGRRVLQIIGKDPSQAGIILPAQIPAALSALISAIAQEEKTNEESKLAAHQTYKPNHQASEEPSQAIPLRQRTLPFVEMLKKCHKAEVEIVWGV